jgi:hypothetical protein
MLEDSFAMTEEIIHEPFASVDLTSSSSNDDTDSGAETPASSVCDGIALDTTISSGARESDLASIAKEILAKLERKEKQEIGDLNVEGKLT